MNSLFKRVSVLALLCLVTCGVNAANFIAKIDRILFVEGTNKNRIYVYPEGGVKHAPACHGENGDYMSFNMERPMAKEYMSGLMMAMSADKRVGFFIEDSCVDQDVSATLRYFLVYKN
ncbi:hypothetical protein [Pleionea litopenaei]|uniref:Uncharacterized protein n=1 Tax=Pleionea litopenaei TaxID=3070815 RepID=A0AA51X6P5_9GAMM|nr:hypothetical protein [Pleionea sp. HL-JVS1]WMS87502.1 hypothetical protein Q9312_00895 [Pleionea sp. HL-JVS1]